MSKNKRNELDPQTELDAELAKSEGEGQTKERPTPTHQKPLAERAGATAVTRLLSGKLRQTADKVLATMGGPAEFGDRRDPVAEIRGVQDILDTLRREHPSARRRLGEARGLIAEITAAAEKSKSE
jgi:hypothetical protein